MRILLFILLSTIILKGQNYTYLVEKYDKVIDLEADIISKIAKDTLKNSKTKIYIPDIRPLEEKVYSSKLKVVKDCKDANFVFIKDRSSIDNCKDNKNAIFFTNNYKRLLSNKKYIGAFFWSKSRPNIVFIRERLAHKNIKLSKGYDNFIEGHDEK